MTQYKRVSQIQRKKIVHPESNAIQGKIEYLAALLDCRCSEPPRTICIRLEPGSRFVYRSATCKQRARWVIIVVIVVVLGEAVEWEGAQIRMRVAHDSDVEVKCASGGETNGSK